MRLGFISSYPRRYAQFEMNILSTILVFDKTYFSGGVTTLYRNIILFRVFREVLADKNKKRMCRIEETKNLEGSLCAHILNLL